MSTQGSIINSLNKSIKNSNSYSEKLASGKRINKAKDDAAGLAIYMDLEAATARQSRGINNANDGISALQIQDGALSSLSDISTRMQELATQAANGTLSDAQRASLNDEYTALAEESQRIINTTEFNGHKLISGNGFSVQVGDGSGVDSRIAIQGSDIESAIASLPADISTQDNARQAIDAVSNFTSTIASERGNIGATQSRISTSIENASAKIESEQAAIARIRDVDVAEAASNKVSADILTNIGASLAAHNNLSKDIVLKLLG